MPRRTTSRTTGRGRSIKTRAATKKKNINDYVEKLPSPRKGDTSLARVPLPAYDTKSYYNGYKQNLKSTKALPSTARPVTLPKGMGRPVYKQSYSPDLKTEEEGWGTRRVTPIPPASQWVKRNGKRVLAFKSPVKRRRPRYDI
jgi:hypothetical protein